MKLETTDLGVFFIFMLFLLSHINFHLVFLFFAEYSLQVTKVYLKVLQTGNKVMFGLLNCWGVNRATHELVIWELFQSYSRDARSFRPQREHFNKSNIWISPPGPPRHPVWLQNLKCIIMNKRSWRIACRQYDMSDHWHKILKFNVSWLNVTNNHGWSIGLWRAVAYPQPTKC